MTGTKGYSLFVLNIIDEEKCYIKWTSGVNVLKFVFLVTIAEVKYAIAFFLGKNFCEQAQTIAKWYTH